MKTANRLPLFALCLMLLPFVGGCQQEQRLAAANDAATTTVKYLNDQRRAHKIDDNTWMTVVVPARKAVAGLLDDAGAYLSRGDKLGLYFLLNSFDEHIAPLLRERFKLQREEPRDGLGRTGSGVSSPAADEGDPAGVPGNS